MSRCICDTHIHTFADPENYPFTESRDYTPQPAPIENYYDEARQLGIEKAVFIQPSVYGSDNTLHLKTAATAPIPARVVVTLEEVPTDEKLASLHAHGVRGVRFNLLFRGGGDDELVYQMAKRLRSTGWHIQLLIDITTMNEVLEGLMKIGTPLVLDHLGHFLSGGQDLPDTFKKVLCSLRDKKVWVKLSGYYRASSQNYPYDAKRLLVEELVKADPDQLVWGSDWPHPAVDVPVPELCKLIQLTENWLENDSMLCKKIFSENAERLYDF